MFWFVLSGIAVRNYYRRMEIDNSYLLPSPNWYLSTVVDCRKSNGQLVYGSRHNIVIVNLKSGVGLPEVRILPAIHRERVTGVQWNPSVKNETDLPSLVSCSDDGSLIAWDVVEEKPILQHKQHEKEKVCGISWSSADPKIVVSCDTGSAVVVWNLDSNTTRKLSYGKINPLIVACNPHCPKTIALGCKGGLLYLCDLTGNGKILHRLRGHDEDIQSISWCPKLKTSSSNISSSDASNWREKEKSEDQFVATAAKDKAIRFWNAKEGRCVLTLKLPSKTGIYKPKTMQVPGRRKNVKSNENLCTKKDDRKTLWVALWWVTSDKLFSSGMGGELLAWNVETLLENKDQKWSVVHSKHARGLFNISGYFVEDSLRVYTSAQDRQIVLWNSAKEKESRSLFTLGGFVYCLNFSPVDPARLAVGVGDNMIRVMNVAASPLEVTSLWQGIRGKVTTVAWHPEKEGKIAFGTEEGRVGLYDVLTTKSPLLSPMTHKSTVYCLTWGPKFSSKGEYFGEQLALYSCGQGQIFIHTFQGKESEEVVNFHTLISSPGRATIPSELAWNTDRSCFAVGHEDGTVDIYKAATLQLMSIIMAQKKLIQSLQWHPAFTAENSDISHFSNYLAVASNESVIKIYDIGPVLNSRGSDSEEADTSELLSVAPLVCSFTGHKERVVSIAWSPHSDGKLLSVSYDGTSKVWDVVEGKAIASYERYNGRLFACGWNPLEEGVAMLGGEDFVLSSWYIHATNDLDANLSRVRHKKNLPQAKGAGIGSEDGKKASSETKAELASLEPTAAKKKVKSLFSVSAALENRGRPAQIEDCKILVDCTDSTLLAEHMRNGGMEHLGFYGDSEALKLLLQQEEKHHLSVGNWEQFITLQMWQGHLAEALQLAAKQRKLNDWMLSMAPQVSVNFWEEMCQKYANQLYLEGDPRKASSYLLSVNKCEQALEMLISKGHFREAIAVARNKFEDGDSRVKEIMETWAKKAVTDSHMEQAAKCYLSLEKWTDAASAIAKKGDVSGLALAASLLKKEGASPMAKVYASQAVYESLMKNDWPLSYQVLADIPETEWYAPVILAHEFLLSSKAENAVNGLTVLTALYKEKSWGDKAKDYYEMVVKNLLTCQPPKLAKAGMIYIAAQVAAAALCQWSVELRFQHLKNMIEAIPISQNVEFAQTLISILLPKGPEDWDCQDKGSELSASDYDLSATLKALQITSCDQSTDINGSKQMEQTDNALSVPESLPAAED